VGGSVTALLEERDVARRRQPHESSPFLTVPGVAARYGCSERSIHGLTRSERIPFLKRARFRHLLFRVKHLDLWDDGAPLETVFLPDGSKLVRPVTP
jgi:hypothetical protein